MTARPLPDPKDRASVESAFPVGCKVRVTSRIYGERGRSHPFGAERTIRDHHTDGVFGATRLVPAEGVGAWVLYVEEVERIDAATEG